MGTELVALAGSAFAVGLLGSAHCAGMCGPLALAVGATGQPGAAGRLGAWILGKAGTYAALGAAAGTVGAAFGSPTLGARPLAALAVAAGVLMAALGARSLWRQAWPAQGSPGPISVLLAALLSRRGPWVPLAAGALTGLLPCGLVYAVTAQSLLTASPVGGAMVMLAFGLGTSPALLGAGMLGSLLRGRTRRLGEIGAAVAVVAMGCASVWRGVALLTGPAGTPPCCH